MTGITAIDTALYLAGSAIAFNVVLPLFAAAVGVAKLLGLI